MIIEKGMSVYHVPQEISFDTCDLDHFEIDSLPSNAPSPGETHMWIIDLNLIERTNFTYGLSTDELLKIDKIIDEGKKQEKKQSRFYLRLILSHYLSIEPSQLLFEYGKNGKPSLLKVIDQNIGFNVTHNSDLLVIAVGWDMDVGVDVESLYKDDFRGIASRYFKSDEQQLVSHQNEMNQRMYFTMLWTCKEAVLKYYGYSIFRLEELESFAEFKFPHKNRVVSMNVYLNKPVFNFWFNNNHICLMVALKVQ